MKFYFCETCGKRITDSEIEQGQGRDKKLKGVYCQNCSVCVMTLEFTPLTDDQARDIVAVAPPRVEREKPRRSNAIGSERSSASFPATSSKRTFLMAGTAVGVVCLIAGLFFMSGSSSGATPAIASSAPQPEKPTSSKTPQEPPAPTPTMVRAAAPLSTPAPAAPLREVHATPKVAPSPKVVKEAPVQQAPAVSSEEAAQSAFDKVMKFDGLDKTDTAGRVKRLNDYIAAYPDTIVVARARIQLANLTAPPKPPPPPEFVSAGSDQDVSLFVPERPNMGFGFDNGQEFPGAKGTLSLDSSMKHDGQSSLHLSGDFTGGGAYVQMGRDCSALHVDPHTLSFALRAPGMKRLTLRLVDGGDQCHQIDLNLEPASDDWKQISFPVERYFATRCTTGEVKSVVRYESWSGAHDGKWRGPLKALYMLIGKVTDDKKCGIWVAGLSIKPRTP